MQVDLPEEGYFIIRSGCADEAVHEPGISESVSVHYRRIVFSDNDVFAVQHGYGRHVGQVFLCPLYGLPFVYGRDHIIDFRGDIPVDKILVPLYLGRAVSADALVPVARERIVERVDAYVEDPVVGIGIFQNHFVHRSLGKLPVEIPFRDEMVAVEVSFPDSPQIEQDHEAYRSCSNVLPCCRGHLP